MKTYILLGLAIVAVLVGLGYWFITWLLEGFGVLP